MGPKLLITPTLLYAHTRLHVCKQGLEESGVSKLALSQKEMEEMQRRDQEQRFRLVWTEPGRTM